jgi:hypothetical protein
MKKNIITSAILLSIPEFVHAATSNINNFNELVDFLTGFAGKLIGLLVTVALVVFFYRIAASIYKVGGGDSKAVDQGKTLLLWGVVALFVMVSVWGIVAYMGEAVGISKGAVIPQLEGHTK